MVRAIFILKAIFHSFFNIRFLADKFAIWYKNIFAKNNQMLYGNYRNFLIVFCTYVDNFFKKFFEKLDVSHVD